MTQRGKRAVQLLIPGCEQRPARDTGGTTGGERETGSECHQHGEPSTPDVEVAIIRDPRKWGPITEPEVFWLHWQRDEVVQEAMNGQDQGLEGPDPDER